MAAAAKENFVKGEAKERRREKSSEKEIVAGPSGGGLLSQQLKVEEVYLRSVHILEEVSFPGWKTV